MDISSNNTEQTQLDNIVDVVYLTQENAEFSVSENKFLQLKARVKNPEKVSADKDNKEKKDETNNSANQNANELEDIFFERVFLHRAFPFDNPYEYISVFASFPKSEEQLAKEKEEREKKAKEEEEKRKAENPDSPAPSPAPPRENTTSFGDLKEVGIITNVSDFGEIQGKYLRDELDRKYFIPVIEQIFFVKEKYDFSYWEVKTDIGKIKFTVHDAYRHILKITDDRIMVNDVNGNRYEIVSLDKLDRPSFRKIELFL